MGNQKFQLISAFTLAALLALSCRASNGQDSSTAKEYQRLSKDFEKKQQEYFKAYEKAKTDAEREKLSEKHPDQRQYAEQMIALALKDPKDPAAVDALVWAVRHAYYDQKLGPKALDAIKKDHVTSQKLDEICRMLTYGRAEDNQEFLKDLLEKNPHNRVKGAASLALGEILARSNPKQAEKYFNDVIDTYGDKEQKENAKGELFEMHNLAIGKAAPEIEGVDVDGKKFKLSDYRGKVVVLDFWGDW